MKTKRLILVVGLAVLALAASTTFVLAQRGPSSSYAGVTGNTGNLDDAQWTEMRTYMEQRFANQDSRGYGSYGGYGGYGGYGSYGGCGGCR
jgi:hypothetical protein